MIAGIQPLRERPEQRAAQILVLSLLILLAVVPPETRGESLAGCALLVGLLALLRWGRGDTPPPGRAALALAVALALPASWAAVAPGSVVEPLAVAILAGAAGVAAAGLAAGGFGPRAMAAVASAGGIVAVHAVYQRLWGLERLARAVAADPDLPDRAALSIRLESGRAFAGFSTPAALGGFLALALPATLALALQSRGRPRWAWIGVAALELAGLLSAASATALAALLAGTVLAWLVWSRGRRALLIGLAATVVLLALVVAQRGAILVDPSEPGSPWRLRAGNFRAAWTMAADHPWLGVGLGGFAEAYPAYRQPGDNETRHVHDLPLELAAEVGWPGALLLGALFFYLFVGPLWSERSGGPPWRRGAALGLAAFALHNLADFTFFMPSLLWTAAIVRGLLARPDRWALAGRRPPVARALAGCSLAGVLLAAVVAALSGMADDQRFAAREAAFSGEFEVALGLAERAARLAPWDVDAALGLAQATVGPGSPISLTPERRLLALERVARAIRLSPVRPSARELRARVRLAQEDAPGAFADMNEAARLYPIRTDYARARDILRERVEPRSAAGSSGR